MTQQNQKIGKIGEDMATSYLTDEGYSILYRNYYSRLGEIDIVARKENTICFVEVKARTSLKCGNPAESVHIQKQQHIRRTAEYFLMKESMKIHEFEKTTFRFDVCNVILKGSDYQKQSLEYIKDAF